MGRHLPDRGQPTSRRRGLATTPVNATRANVGPRGRHLPDRGQIVFVKLSAACG
jgi:hypothetical protein